MLTGSNILACKILRDLSKTDKLLKDIKNLERIIFWFIVKIVWVIHLAKTPREIKQYL